MKTKTRERAIRILLSSIIGSDLTVHELQELSEAFLRDGDFSQDLGLLIKSLAVNLKAGFHFKKQEALFHLEDTEYSLEEAIDIVKRKRLSKKRVVSLIEQISPKAGDYYDSKKEKLTLKEILEKFFTVHGQQQFNEFMNLVLRGHRSQDEYLKGIMRNR